MCFLIILCSITIHPLAHYITHHNKRNCATRATASCAPPLHRMRHCITCATASHSPLPHTRHYLTYAPASHAPLSHMRHCHARATASPAPLRYMRHYVTCATALHAHHISPDISNKKVPTSKSLFTGTLIVFN